MGHPQNKLILWFCAKSPFFDGDIVNDDINAPQVQKRGNGMVPSNSIVRIAASLVKSRLEATYPKAHAL